MDIITIRLNNNNNNNNLGFILITMEHPFFLKRKSHAFLLNKITRTLTQKLTTIYNFHSVDMSIVTGVSQVLGSRPDVFNCELKILWSLKPNAFTNKNVFYLDINVAVKFNSFNGEGNLIGRRDAIYENALSDKHPSGSDAALGTSNQKASSAVLKPMLTWIFWRYKRSAKYLLTKL